MIYILLKYIQGILIRTHYTNCMYDIIYILFSKIKTNQCNKIKIK